MNKQNESPKMKSLCEKCGKFIAIKSVCGVELCSSCSDAWENSKITLGELQDLKENKENANMV